MNTKYQSKHNHLLYNYYLWATCFDSLEPSSGPTKKRSKTKFASTSLKFVCGLGFVNELHSLALKKRYKCHNPTLHVMVDVAIIKLFQLFIVQTF